MQKYQAIMAEETWLAAEKFGNFWDTVEPEEAYNTVLQIAGIAKAGTVIRSYHKCYHLTGVPMAFESVSAHTNLMLAMIDRALVYTYGAEIQCTEDGYTYREIMEAARRHDLPENVTGDIHDDGDRDEDAKIQAEQKFQREFSSLSPNREMDSEPKVLRLLIEMEEKSSPTGKLLYTADKAAAPIMALCYDDLKLPPLRYERDEFMTQRDRKEVKLCDREKVLSGNHRSVKKAYYASEMWTMDFLKMRELVQYDETGFFTALIVMYTLQVHDHWYSWRETDYRPDYHNQ